MKAFGSRLLNSAACRYRPGSPRWFALGVAGWLALAGAAVPLPAQSLLFAQYFGPAQQGYALVLSDFRASQQTADSFSLTSASAVTRVRWYGEWSPPGTTFQMRFFANAGSSPLAAPFSDQTVTPVKTATSIGAYEYVANLSPAVTFDPGVTYYISIVGNTSSGLLWSWVFADHSGSKANYWTRAIDASVWAPISSGSSNKLSFELFGFTGTDVGVQIAATPDPLHGQNLTYLITVTNHGLLTAKYVILEDVLPPEVTFKKVTTPGTAFTPDGGSTGTVLINLGDLAPGATSQTSLVVKVGTKDASTISNTVSVSSTTGDPDQANNTATSNISRK